jgi:hypothetical protein
MKLVSRSTGKTYRLTVLEYMVLRIFGPEEEKIETEKKTEYVDLHNLHFSPNIVTEIKAWKTRWVAHVARIAKKK